MPNSLTSSAQDQQQAAETRSLASALTEKANLVDNGDIVSAKELADALNQTEPEIVKKFKSFCLPVIYADSYRFYYPAFLKEHKLYSAGLLQVLEVLSVQPAWNQWLFFKTTDARYSGKTPLEALRQYKLHAVLTHAKEYLP